MNAIYFIRSEFPLWFHEFWIPMGRLPVILLFLVKMQRRNCEFLTFADCEIEVLNPIFKFYIKKCKIYEIKQSKTEKK